jgi:pyridoxal phosphate enzyme (YggS family)
MPFSDLPERLAAIQSRIADARARGGHGQDVTIIAVTKTHEAAAVEAAWGAGVADVGENKVQEALDKQGAVQGPARDARWHLIGHLQRNKVKHLDRFHLFHGCDREALSDEIDAFGRKRGAPIDVLMQVNVVGEESKGGYSPAGWEREAERLTSLVGLRVLGVMTMAPFDADEATLRTVFRGAREAREALRRAGHVGADALSMGMSGDYEIAVEEGATMVRLGTILFGART